MLRAICCLILLVNQGWGLAVISSSRGTENLACLIASHSRALEEAQTRLATVARNISSHTMPFIDPREIDSSNSGSTLAREIPRVEEQLFSGTISEAIRRAEALFSGSVALNRHNERINNALYERINNALLALHAISGDSSLIQTNDEPLQPTLSPNQTYSICTERTPYSTSQYNTAAYILQSTPQLSRYMEGYITHLMQQAEFPALLARTIVEEILNGDFNPTDTQPPVSTEPTTLQVIIESQGSP